MDPYILKLRSRIRDLEEQVDNLKSPDSYTFKYEKGEEIYLCGEVTGMHDMFGNSYYVTAQVSNNVELKSHKIKIEVEEELLFRSNEIE